MFTTKHGPLPNWMTRHYDMYQWLRKGIAPVSAANPKLDPSQSMRRNVAFGSIHDDFTCQSTGAANTCLIGTRPQLVQLLKCFVTHCEICPGMLGQGSRRCSARYIVVGPSLYVRQCPPQRYLFNDIYRMNDPQVRASAKKLPVWILNWGTLLSILVRRNNTSRSIMSAFFERYS